MTIKCFGRSRKSFEFASIQLGLLMLVAAQANAVEGNPLVVTPPVIPVEATPPGTQSASGKAANPVQAVAELKEAGAEAKAAAEQARAAANDAACVSQQARAVTWQIKDLIEQARAGEKNGLVAGVDKALTRAGKSLDKIERHLAEWGHASISGFVLVEDRTNYFDLKYDAPTADYVAAVRTNTQGKAAFLEQKELTTELTVKFANAMPGLNVQGPPAAPTIQQTAAIEQQAQIDTIVQQIRIAQLQKELARVTNAADGWHTNLLTLPLSAGTTPPTNPPSGPTNLVPQLPTITNLSPAGPATNGFSPFGGLAAQLSGNQLSETTILKLAATAKETERVLNFMSHPVAVAGDKQVFFAIGQISVMPGWRTRQDYICEVSARFTYAGPRQEIITRYKNRAQVSKNHLELQLVDCIEKEDQQEQRSGYDVVYANGGLAKRLGIDRAANSLSLVSAFPFMESQVFDLQNSYRSRLSFLLNLAGTYLQAGYKIDAEMLLRYVKQIEKDISTRTAFPTVIPGVDSAVLTYRFDPQAAAMLDPVATKPQAGNLLLPTSIPVMVLFVTSKKDLAQWPEIALEVQTRWLPRTDHSFWKTVFVDAPFRNRIMDKRMKPSEQLEITAEFDKAMDALTTLKNAGQGDRESYDELRRKLALVQMLGWGRTTRIAIEPSESNDAGAGGDKAKDANEPKCTDRPRLVITDIKPRRGFINSRTTFTIFGSGFAPKGFDDPVKLVSVGGRVAENVRVISDSVVQFEVAPWNDGSTNAPFYDNTHVAEVIVASACQVLSDTQGVHFDIKMPVVAAAQPEPSDADKLIDKQAKALKALQALQTNGVSQLIGSLRLEVGNTSVAKTNLAPGTSSTVIIQNGQNTNSVR